LVTYSTPAREGSYARHFDIAPCPNNCGIKREIGWTELPVKLAMIVTQSSPWLPPVTNEVLGKIFNDFSSRSFSGTDMTHTRILPGWESKSAAISLQSESAGYGATVSEIQAFLGMWYASP
jgi:hypothetical protein